MDATLKHPSIYVIIGPTAAGKTTWIEKLILNSQNLIFPPPKQIVFCYAENQSIYSKLKANSPIPIKFHYGLTEELYETIGSGTLLVVDDLLRTTSKDLLLNIVQRGSHHRGISLVIVAHNLFDKSLRSISLQSHYLVLMKTARDFDQIKLLGIIRRG